jgi:uncharacterized protein DUF6461
MVLDELVNSYHWTKKIEAWTVAVTEGRTPEEVLRIYGGSPERSMGEFTAAELDARQRLQDDHRDFYLRILCVGDRVVALENNGYSGAFPEIARRCSADGGRFFSVYWSIAGAGTVTQAVDGAIVANFEPIFPIEPEEQEWERRPEWAIGPEVDVELARQTCLAQLEQQTGVAVLESWLRGRHPTYPIPAPYEHYRDVPGAGHP